VILCFAIGYGVTSRCPVMVALVVVHGVFWSGLLSASAAYLTHLLPERRRAEGIGYWGLSSVAAIAVAPPIAFWIMQHGGSRWVCISCGTLNLLMGGIACALPDDPAHDRAPLQLGPTHGSAPTRVEADPRVRPLVEWRILALSVTLFLYSFGYGAITSFSAMYADAIGVSPKSLYLTVLAVVILLTRPLSGSLADRVGYRRVLLPCLVLIAAGLTVLATGSTRLSLVASAVIFGVGFGTAYPVFVAHVLRDVGPERRGAAFGAILAAFDTGIGTGSTTVGWLIEHVGFSTAFGVAAALSAVALPYFVVVDRRLQTTDL
jgi:MFS family permease